MENQTENSIGTGVLYVVISGCSLPLGRTAYFLPAKTSPATNLMICVPLLYTCAILVNFS